MLKNIERSQEGVDSWIDRTRDAVVDVAERAESGAEAAAREAHRRVERAARAIDRGYARTRGEFSRAATSATDYVAENPGKALLLAASAGFLLAMLTNRRRAR